MKNVYNLLLSSVAINFPIAFQNEPGWKLDKDGKMELKDGNPIYVDASGREMTIESGTITRLNGEARDLRTQKEAVEKKLEAFKDIKDPAIALKAIETVSKLDAKKLIDAGEVDKVREQVKNEFMGQMEESKKTNDALQSRLNKMLTSNAFANSAFIRDNVALPGDIIEAYFRDNVKIEEDKPVFYYKDGNKVMTKDMNRYGQAAGADEALQLLIEAHPQKDMLLKASNANGSGNNGNGGSRGHGRSMQRTEFDKLQPAEQATVAAQMSKGEINIVD